MPCKYNAFCIKTTICSRYSSACHVLYHFIIDVLDVLCIVWFANAPIYKYICIRYFNRSNPLILY